MENIERRRPEILEPEEEEKELSGTEQEGLEVDRRAFLRAAGAALGGATLGGEALAQGEEKYTYPDYRVVESMLKERRDVPPGVTQYVAQFFRKNNASLEFIDSGRSHPDTKNILRHETLWYYDHFSFNLTRKGFIEGKVGENFPAHHKETLDSLRTMPSATLLARLNQWASEYEIEKLARDLDRKSTISLAKIAGGEGSWQGVEQDMEESLARIRATLANPAKMKELTTSMQKNLFASDFRVKPSNDLAWFTNNLKERLAKTEEAKKRQLAELPTRKKQ